MRPQISLWGKGASSAGLTAQASEEPAILQRNRFSAISQTFERPSSPPGSPSDRQRGSSKSISGPMGSQDHGSSMESERASALQAVKNFGKPQAVVAMSNGPPRGASGVNLMIKGPSDEEIAVHQKEHMRGQEAKLDEARLENLMNGYLDEWIRSTSFGANQVR